MREFSPRLPIRGALIVILALATVALFNPPAAAKPTTGIKLDHFLCYITQGPPVNETIGLQDQFDPAGALMPAVVQWPVRFCNPVAKRHANVPSAIIDPDAHLKLYLILPAPTTAPPPAHTVVVSNQFGKHQKLRVFSPEVLAVPTHKLQPGPHDPPQGLDHFKCYRAFGRSANATVSLADEFHGYLGVGVFDPVAFCNPTVKVHAGQRFEIQNPDAHLVCYRLAVPQFLTFTALVENQFGSETLAMVGPDLLCVPSVKLSFTTP